MALEEKRAWVMVAVIAVTYLVYLVVVLSRLGGGAVAETPYVGALLWTAGASIVVTIVLSIAAELTTPKDSRKKDERDREIGRFGDYIGQSFVAIGGVAALLMAMAEFEYFWIANTVYLCFALSSVLSSVVKIFVYRRGFQTW